LILRVERQHSTTSGKLFRQNFLYEHSTDPKQMRIAVNALHKGDEGGTEASQFFYRTEARIHGMCAVKRSQHSALN